MNSQHTPGRLKVGRHGAILGGPEFEFANGSGVKQLAMACVVPEGVEGDQESNARRLVACWNTCDGVSTKSLESNPGLNELAAETMKLMDQCDEMLAALKSAHAELARVERIMLRECGVGVVNLLEIQAIQAAINKAEKPTESKS